MRTLFIDHWLMVIIYTNIYVYVYHIYMHYLQYNAGIEVPVGYLTFNRNEGTIVARNSFYYFIYIAFKQKICPASA